MEGRDGGEGEQREWWEGAMRKRQEKDGTDGKRMMSKPEGRVGEIGVRGRIPHEGVIRERGARQAKSGD